MKFCLIGEFEKIAKSGNSTFYDPPPQVADYAAEGYMSDYRNRCMVIPIIDESDIPLNESTMIVCWP